MRGRRGTAVVGALLSAALATAGCGLGPGAEVGDVGLTVTREFGAVPVLDASVEANESDTVMRVLEGEAAVETRYGGGFVHSIDGVAEGSRGGDPYDWFFYVDGVESEVGAAEYDLEGGERVWWDYRDWATTNHVPAVVGSWPAPFGDGIGGERHPVVVECEGGGEACDEARAALEREGVEVSSGAPDDAIRVLVGPWARVRQDPAARLIETGPAESGVFADFQAGVRPFHGIDGERTNAEPVFELLGLDEAGRVAHDLGPGAGLVAATSRYGGLPVWVVTGGTPAAVRAAAAALDAEHLRARYAVAVEDGETTPLPLEER
ncbi:MAG TPA: DUF4430 domain-containing protein [Solirubrobacterales bacterium]|nr:DUF4430 domain-containing protein [Solirubrobacterales bacterium]